MKLSHLKNEPAGGVFQLPLVISEAELKTASNNNQFLSLTLSDSSDKTRSVIFSDNKVFNVIRSMKKSAGAFMVTLSVDFYNGNLSPKIQDLFEMSETQLEDNLSELIPQSNVDVATLTNKFLSFYKLFENTQLFEAVSAMVSEKWRQFLIWPAAKKMHHNYKHGLLEHTVDLCEKVIALTEGNREELNRDVLLATAMVHDLYKVEEYSWDPLSQTSEITQIGHSVGHLVLAYEAFNIHARVHNVPEDLRDMVAHCILSHHGQLDWGSPVAPGTEEAVTFHYLDQISAKLAAIGAHRKEFPDKIEYCPILGKPVIYKNTK